MSVTRTAHVGINVTDMDAALGHYVGLLGLQVAERTATQAYLRAPDDQDHHCLILNLADSAGVDHVGLKVNRPDDLDEVERLLERAGSDVGRISSGEEVGQGEGVRFKLPAGDQTFEVFYHVDKVGYATGMLNPTPRPQDHRPAQVSRLDHLLVSTTDAHETSTFMTEVLDFDSSERLLDPAGRCIAAWMYCTNTMHDVAMSPGPAGGLHHVAFWVDSRADVIRAAKVLKAAGTRLAHYGVTRHGISGVTTVYFHDPSGNRNEIFYGSYVTPGAPGRLEPVDWDMENFARGAFYYENELDMQFFEDVT